MTERLYEQDSFIRTFTATVIACTPLTEGFAIELDRTAFFPEGGGQAADGGTLNGVAVTDVRLRDGVILHSTATALPVGATVTGEIDWDTRFRRMQKHTGEHIVSGLIDRLYGLQNVGFHLGSADVTLDLDGELTREQLDRIEDLANAAVAADVAVTARYPSPEELATLNYRSKKEIKGAVRIVTVEGYDVCACCAPHVHRTGEIGIIKLLDFIRYKGGIRIHMQCGFDALADYRMRYIQTATIAASLSAKQEEVADAVVRLLSQRDALERELASCKRRLALTRIESLPSTDGALCLIEPPLDGATMADIASAGAAKCGKLCVVFSGTDAAGYTYVAMGGAGLQQFSAQIGETLHGRGGGSPQRVQGRVQATEQEIRAFWDTWKAAEKQ